MKPRYFTSIILLTLLMTVANCTKETNEPPDTVKEFMLLKKETTFYSNSGISVINEFTYYSDGRIKHINENDDFTWDLTYSGDTLFSHQISHTAIHDSYVKTYRMNDSMVYVESIFVDHPIENPDSVIFTDTTITLYIYYLSECGYRKRIDENGQQYDNFKTYTDENCSWTSENMIHTLDDKHSYLISVVTNLYTNYNVGNIIYHRANAGLEFTYDYIYNDSDYPVSATYHAPYGDLQITYEYY